MQNRFPIANSELLPQFFVKKIIIGEQNVRVICALRRPTDINYDNWISDSEFNSYIKYYFVANPGTDRNIADKFYRPSTRTELMARASERPRHLWETSLGPQFDEEPDAAAPNPYDFKGWTSVSLREILQGQYFVKDPLTATQSREPMHPDAVDNVEGYNTYFEVNVALDPSATRPNGVVKLDLIAFSQLDILSMKEDFNLRSIPSGLYEIGSNLLYERCLKRSPSTGRLSAVSERPIFFTEDGLAYMGPRHYHGENNPGPGGYIGYMSGPRGIVDMSGQVKLSRRLVKNNKVFYINSIESALNFDGQPLNEENSFSGFSMDQASIITPAGLMSFGDNIRSALSAQSGNILSITRPRSDIDVGLIIQDSQQVRQAPEYSERLRSLALNSVKRGKILSGQEFSWLELNEVRSFQGLVFFLNLEEIVSANSKFSYLYEAHKNLDGSRSFLQTVLKRSIVKSLEIRRQRIQNDPNSNNAVSSPTFGIFDTDEVLDTIIIASGDRFGRIDNIINNASNLSAEIQEIDPNANRSLKCIYLKDFDLFENYHTGKYRYLIDLKIEDGFLFTLKMLKSNFKTVLNNYIEYVEEAQRPYLDYTQSGYYNGSQFANGPVDQIERENGATIGNYIHSTDSFTEQFKERSRQLRIRSDDIVEAYVTIYYILTASESFSEAQAEELKTSLLAENVNLSGLEYFLNLCQKLYDRLCAIIEYGGSKIEDTLNLGSNRRSVMSDSTLPSGIMHVEGKTKTTVSAQNKNQVFVRPRNNIPNARPDGIRGIRQPALIENVGVRDFIALRPHRVNRINQNAINLDTSTSYEHVKIATPGVEISLEESIEISARVQAAVQASLAGYPSVEYASSNRDRFVEMQNLMSRYGGIEVSSIPNRLGLLRQSDLENRTAAQIRGISTEIQNSILNSFTRADSSQQFAEEVRESYAGYIIQEEALNRLYIELRSALSISQEFYQTTTDTLILAAQNVNYKNLSRESRRLQIEKQKRRSLSNMFRTYTFDSQGNLRESINPGEFGITVYLDESNSFPGVVVSNNVTFNQSFRSAVQEFQSLNTSGVDVNTVITVTPEQSNNGGGGANY